MNAVNTDLVSQVKSLEFILGQSSIIPKALRHVQKLDLPNWYVGAGCIAQTVWNFLAERELSSGILDLDVAYFDGTDLSDTGERRWADKAQEFLRDIPLKVDVKNQARVHLWHQQHFGYPIRPYQSVEDAINSWPTTATCIGVKYRNDEFVVYAPYGLNDLFGMIIKPNKVKITEEIYREKATRWKHCWSMLQILPW